MKFVINKLKTNINHNHSSNRFIYFSIVYYSTVQYNAIEYISI